VSALGRSRATPQKMVSLVWEIPVPGNHGRGVTIDIQNDDQLEVAYDQAKLHSDGVIVEHFIKGLDHRLLVVNGRLVAAAKRVPGHVVGDGRHTVAELVAKVNQDPRRGVGHEKVLTQIKLDHQALRLLAERGYDGESVPPEGEVLYLRTTANLSTGGTAVDVTDIIHPDNQAMAERAIRAIGLDVGGVDFLTTDISESYRTTGGAICEVNAAPGFRMHVSPSEGKPRDVATPVIDMLFPPGAESHIPIAAITGTNGKTTTSRMVGHILKLAGHTVGLASTDGVYIDGQLTVAGDMTGPVAAQMILRDPSVDAAVLETARGGLLRAGMGYRESDVSACLNIAADHLGQRGINTLEDLAKVKRIVVEVAQKATILNADDGHCLKMADHTSARRIGYVTLNHQHPLVREHIQQGGLAVVLEQGLNGQMITLYDGQQHTHLLWSHLIPATLEGKAIHNVQNAMFAAAISYALGISLENIRQGLRTFDTSFFQTPGRMNLYNEHPFKVILDYAHNPAAVRNICSVVDRFDAKRKILVLGGPGDRRDQDIQQLAAIAAGHFDFFICRDDDDLRGRDSGEVAGLLRQALLDAGVAAENIKVILSEVEANEAALAMARSGDLILTLVEAVSRTWKQIIYFKPNLEPLSAEGTRRDDNALLETLAAELPLGDDPVLVRDERGVRLAREPGSER
ncbi:MAG: cyanophycin synthetase, partial [Candidatus Competibacterales bacterium]